ncbi:IL1B protein, partial [Psilopogon haemacephalus]|nr:IL1B protein [Psilopogon haemacephalus]
AAFTIYLPLPSSLSEETFYGPSCLCPQEKPHLEVKMRSPEVGIQVTVTEGHSARTFRRAAVLVAAVAKLRRQPRRDFADSDLGDLLDEIFEPVPFQHTAHSCAGAPVYRYTRSQSFDILDIDHKCFVLESPTQLVALHLQGPSAKQKGERSQSRAPRHHPAAPRAPLNPSLPSAVKLNIALYRPRAPQGSGGVPVALGIKGYQLYMACVQGGAQPVLQLEEADIRRDIDSSELLRFIFFRLDS